MGWTRFFGIVRIPTAEHFGVLPAVAMEPSVRFGSSSQGYERPREAG